MPSCLQCQDAYAPRDPCHQSILVQLQVRTRPVLPLHKITGPSTMFDLCCRQCRTWSIFVLLMDVKLEESFPAQILMLRGLTISVTASSTVSVLPQ